MLNSIAGALTPVLYPHTSTVVNTQPAETAPVISFTQKPNVIIDQFLHLLSGAETKVLDYISRRTFGFGKTCDKIAIEQFVSGIVTEDGKRLDYGTGLSKSSVKAALRSLIAKGVIGEQRRWGRHGGELASIYWIILDTDFGMVKGDEIYTAPSVKNCPTLDQESAPPSVNSCPHKRKTGNRKIYRNKDQQHIPAELQVTGEEKPKPEAIPDVVVQDLSEVELDAVQQIVNADPDEPVSMNAAVDAVVNNDWRLCLTLVAEYKKRKAAGKAARVGWLVNALQNPKRKYSVPVAPTGTNTPRFDKNDPYANPERSRTATAKPQERELQPVAVKPSQFIGCKTLQRIMERTASRAAAPAPSV